MLISRSLWYDARKVGGGIEYDLILKGQEGMLTCCMISRQILFSVEPFLAASRPE